MNIKRAKQEIKQAVAAYLEKDDEGLYRIPPVHQRPILLMGPPGIGKTQIMEQIARECDLALVSYTITHHTRQSAIGLPFIREKTYAGQKKSITEYTMSEILATVYDRMEASGKKEGILFIDEINCVSETLAPAMLQFLQMKTFGNQQVPEGWIIVAAGNPPAYNRSVREFDVVTLDRVKVIWVEPDYEAWKEYAWEAGIHGSILAYLDIHRENFYRIETTVDGKEFVTARGWQDLSEMIKAFERLGFVMDREGTIQYLQHPQTAKDFANYLELFYKYRADYRIDEVLQGTIRQGALQKLKFASFDERLEVTGLLLSSLSQEFRAWFEKDRAVGKVFETIKKMRENISAESLHAEKARLEKEQESRLQSGQDARALKGMSGDLPETLENYARLLEDHPEAKGEAAFALIQDAFSQKSEELETTLQDTGAKLEHAFDFMETAFGESQEMVVFITELSSNRYAVAFLQEYDCDRYYMYNRGLLFADREKDIRSQLDAIRRQQTGESHQ